MEDRRRQVTSEMNLIIFESKDETASAKTRFPRNSTYRKLPYTVSSSKKENFLRRKTGVSSGFSRAMEIDHDKDAYKLITYRIPTCRS